MFKGIEHPSAFPSMLRSTTPSQSQIDLRNGAGTPTNKSEPYHSHTIPRRRNSAASNLSRRDSTVSIDRRYNSSLDRRNSIGLARNPNHGSSIYLRADSSGTTNLIRRDSFGSQGIRRDSFSTARTTSPFPRDYVSKSVESTVTSTPRHEPNSILRKNSSKDDDINRIVNKENVTHKLTAANLTKHVTILENNGKDTHGNGTTAKSTDGDGDNTSNYSGRDRRDSSGSLGSYLLSRRISIDSLDPRRGNNTRRSSYASVELDGSLGDWRKVGVSYLKHKISVANLRIVLKLTKHHQY